jgi:hypothetical protein
MKKKRTYRSSIKHLIYNLKKLQFSINKRGGKIPIDLCICRYRLEEYIKMIELLEKKGCTIDKTGMKTKTFDEYLAELK